MTIDPTTVQQLATEHILDDARRAHDIGAGVLGHFGPDALTKHEYGAWCSAIREAIQTATVAVSWPAAQPEHGGDVRALAGIMWLTQDDEGNVGVWCDPDNAREQIISDRFAETPGAYEWVNDPDRTHEVLLRDDEMTGVTLWMACVADAALEARDAKAGGSDV